MNAYLEAAKLIENGQESYACVALSSVIDPDSTYGTTDLKECKVFRKWLKPETWYILWYTDPTLSWEQNQLARQLGLLLVAELEAENV